MAYVYTPFKKSQSTVNASRTAKNDEKTLRNFYQNGYSDARRKERSKTL